MSYSSEVLADAPVRYWWLDEREGTVAADKTGNANGTYVGGPALDESPAVGDGRSVTFAGGGQYMSTTSVVASLSSWTLEAWIRVDTVVDGSRFISDRSAATGFIGFSIALVTGEARLRLQHRDNSSRLTTVTATSGDLGDGRWHHVVARMSGLSFTLWKDGVQVGAATRIGSTSLSSTVLRVAQDSVDGPSYGFRGGVDEVAVYPVALSNARILAHFQAGYVPVVVEVPSASSAIVSLREMVGVNVHMSYNNLVYGNAPLIRSKLTDLGVRHVRDYFVPNRAADEWPALASFGALGIDVLLGIGAQFIDGANGGVAAAVAAAKAAIPNIDAFEGLNEYDLSGDADWKAVARAHNDALRQAVVKDPELVGRIPVIAASIVFNATAATDDYLLNADSGNKHPYPGGAWETTAHLASEITATRKMSGRLPLWASEWGYHTATSGYIAPGHPAVTETQQRDRMIAGLLTMQGAEWQRVYIYELIDEGNPANGMEQSFGLYRNAGAAKPAAVALKLWLTWIGDLMPAAESFGLTVSPGINWREYGSSTSEHFVALWRESEVSAQNVTITMTDAIAHWTFARFKASTGSGGQAPASNANSYVVPSVGSEPVLIQIRRQA